jgi:hypothetical protein
MAKLIVSCDEKFPVFDLEVPEEGQIPNCEISEQFHKEFLYFTLKYLEIQKELSSIYEESRRNSFRESNEIRFPKSARLDNQCEYNRSINATKAEI